MEKKESAKWQKIYGNFDKDNYEEYTLRGLDNESHIYYGEQARPFNLTVTLSIRNTDPNAPITIVKVEYYSSDGGLLKNYLDGPVQLKSLASTRYIIKERDTKGGSGANFIVKWKSEKIVNAPIIETVMIGTSSQQGISFTSRGQVIKEEKELK